MATTIATRTAAADAGTISLIPSPPRDWDVGGNYSLVGAKSTNSPIVTFS
jgi:hypothetical protein